MAKIYALFKNEKDALGAIDKIEKLDEGAKISFFHSSSSSLEDEVFNSDINIIGSPAPISSNQTLNDGEFSGTTNSEIGLFPFCNANFVSTCKNSLMQPENEKLGFPKDAYCAGIFLSAPERSMKDIKRILKKKSIAIF